MVPILASAQQHPNPPSYPVSYRDCTAIRRSRGGGRGIGDDFLHHLLDGPVVRAVNVPGRGVAAFMAVSILAACSPSTPSAGVGPHGRRTSLPACARSPRCGGRHRSPRPCLVRYFCCCALFSARRDAVFPRVSHVNDKLEPAQMVAASSALLLMKRQWRAAAAGGAEGS